MRLCVSCSSRVKDPGTKRCRACLRALSGPSPLRTWREETGRSLDDLAEVAELSRATVHRAAAGVPTSRRVAQKLSQVTGLDDVVFLRGTRWT